MVINENNSYTNSFTAGMNSDLAYDLLKNNNYVYAKNIRVTKNLLLGSLEDNYASLHEGVITPVYDGVNAVWYNSEDEDNPDCDIQLDEDLTILSVDSVDNIGVITGINAKKLLVVYRVCIDQETDKNHIDTIQNATVWWRSEESFDNTTSVSTVLYKELDNVIKLYIATGEEPIITLRVDDLVGPYLNTEDPENPILTVSVDDFISNRVIPTDCVYIQGITSGKLKTSQVQYTYRYYNKHGITTQLAPLTNKIQVIDPNRNKEVGNAEDTETSLGFILKINVGEFYGRYERMLIYRLQYIKPEADAEVSLIYDGEVKSNNEGYMLYNDVGIDALQSLTMEEFSVMSGLIITPTIIETNQLYMFASNVKDETIIKNLQIRTQEDGPNKTLKTKEARVILSSTNETLNAIPTTITDEEYSSDQNNVFDAVSYFSDRNINVRLAKPTYNNIFTSSLLRSLRRGESYKYGIVYYDKYGRRSDVLSLGDIDIPEPYENTPFQIVDNTLVAKPIGVEIDVPQPLIEVGATTEVAKDIIGCQIVRRSSKPIYQKTLMQVALARPVNQLLYTLSNFEGKMESPYYPTGYLLSNKLMLSSYYYSPAHIRAKLFNEEDYLANSYNNDSLFLIFSTEIDFRRDDAVSVLNQNESYLNPIYFLYPDNDHASINTSIIAQTGLSDESLFFSGDKIFTNLGYLLTKDNKQSEKLILDYYNCVQAVNNNTTFTDKKYPITVIKDVKIPKWYDGFSDIQYNGSDIIGGIKKYKSFTTSIENYKYVNWVASGLYDFRIYYADSQPNLEDTVSLFLYNETHHSKTRNYSLSSIPGVSTEGLENREESTKASGGYIGPGPSCLLMKLNLGVGGNKLPDISHSLQWGCAIANIRHDIEFLNSEPDEFVLYFGFGNFFKLEYDELNNIYNVVHADGSKNSFATVFDGDIYITPHEITTMYKTYDFLSFDTLESMLVTNYVPLESKVNTYFDYGMNLLNTDSSNLIYDGGSIEGVTSQDRPVHQYNMIYSDNDASNDVFSLTVTDKNETNLFKQRTYYSEPKTNGEYVDNFNVFKPASFIDVDSKYGEITDLFTDKNTLYYWLNTAFGKFSVNERSLINDQNGNTIMLGQAGILSRNDYISTKYGMRPYDYCVTSTEKGVYWIDINNRAIVASDGKQVVNLGESLNVLNIINNNISLNDVPKIDYDLQNDELLCKCLKHGEQLVFNLKYNIATSIYTREYIDMLYIYNHIYGLYKESSINDQNGNTIYLYAKKYNYLTTNDRDSFGLQFLNPLELQFVSNGVTSVTKVFDSLTIIPIKRDSYNGADTRNLSPERHDEAVGSYLNSTTFAFETDILGKNTNNIEPHTDREGNIIYTIPRYGNDKWGNRMRGKWLKVDITNEDVDEYFTISHVITKIRQSYS